MSLYPVSPFNLGLGYDPDTTSSQPSQWDTTYLIDAPPAIVYQQTSSDTAYLYIPWVYPAQIHVNFINQLLPLILSQTLRLYVPSLSWNPQSIIEANTANLGITGLVLTAKPPYGVSFTTWTFPGETVPRNVCLYSDALLFNLPYNVNNRLNAFYSGYQTYSNDSYVILPPFAISGPPSAPRAPMTFTLVTATGMTITYVIPQYTDGLNLTNTPAVIIGYKAVYSTPGSTIRYPSAISQTTQTDIYGAFLSHALVSLLYPDSVYSIDVSAINDINLSYGPSLSATQSTGALAQPASLGALSFPSRFTTTAYLASDTSATTPITNLTTTSTDWTSSSAQFNINTTATRGNLGSGALVSLTTQTVRNAITNNGPTTAFNGFPITTPSTSTTNNITVTPTINTDAYTLAEQQGFFLNGNTTFTIGTSLFVAGPYETVFTATQTPGNASTWSYNYDSVTGSPGVASVTFDFAGITTYAMQISGVYIFTGTPPFAVTSSLTNMGTYFYSQDPVTYNLSVGGTITSQNRTNMVGVTGITAGVMGTLGVSDTVTSSTLDTTFSIATNNTALTSLVAYNVINSTTNTSATPFSAVIDGPSYNLIYNVHAQTLAGATTSNGSYVVGLRCYSGAVVYLGLFPAYLFGSLRYSTQPYDNKILLTATPGAGVQDQRQELQCCNGVLRNSGATSSGWIDYTSYKYFPITFNTANYSGVSAITRYSTFTWQVANNASLYTSLSFNVYGLSGTITVTGGIAYINGTALQFYYRLEDSNSAVPDGTQTYLSSVWCDAQSVNGNSSYVSSANYSSPSGATITTYRGGLDTGAVWNGSVLTLPVLFPCRQFTVSTTNVVIYARVGIPAGTGGFTYVSANIF